MGVLDMLNESLVVRIRLIVYCVLVFFSFFIIAGVSVMREKFFYKGVCPLYSHYGQVFPPSANCNYPIAIAVIFQLIYTLVRIVILVLLAVGKVTTDTFLFSNLMELFYVLVDVSALVLTFIGACILSAGRNDTNVYFGDTSVTNSNIAQAGAWISTILWLLVAVVGVLYIVRAGKVPFFIGGAGAASSGPSGGIPPASAPPVDPGPNYDPPKY